MSSEILSVLEYMEKEKGIGREDMISAIVTAIKNAAGKGVNAGQELKIDIDPKNGKMQAWALLEVVDSMSDPKTEIVLEKARLITPDICVGVPLVKLRVSKPRWNSAWGRTIHLLS